MYSRLTWLVPALLLAVACGEPERPPPAPSAEGASVLRTGEGKHLYWGDTHLHTSYSPDAFLFGNQSADPDTAYRYAKGLPVIHPLHRARIQISTPFDFLVVSDHGEFMGVIPRLLRGDPELTETPMGKQLLALRDAGRVDEAFAELLRQANENDPSPDLYNKSINRSVWTEIMDAAERHNEPGTFTAFLGWEWSSTPKGANLHRVVVMRDGKEVGEQFLPYTSFDSPRPEDLWTWLASTAEATGGRFLSIPHNSNLSNGLMFAMTDSDGRSLDTTYAEARMRWERVVEVTQIKGDSETHAALASYDEFADFETYEHLLATGDYAGQATADPGDYVRSALSRGISLATTMGANPYQFGLIGSTDSHTGMASAEEDNFHGKMAIDGIPENKSQALIAGARGFDMSASGLVAVWAEENTRESLFDAISRREVYATTGPRIRVSVSATQNGTTVSMGGVLSGAAEAPKFVISAQKDPKDANLDRIQIIKGWSEGDGTTKERIFDVALSGGREAAPDGSVAPVGDTVNVESGTYENDIGSAELNAAWSDPAFDAAQHAYYYVRVLQIPTPRHSLLDAIALGMDPDEVGAPMTIQERAYTSPIWYRP